MPPAFMVPSEGPPEAEDPALDPVPVARQPQPQSRPRQTVSHAGDELQPRDRRRGGGNGDQFDGYFRVTDDE